MKIRTLIVDNEPLAIDVLEELIKGFPQLLLVKKCGGAPEAIAFLRNNKVDLMFLDIMMPEMTGIQLLQSLPNPPMVVFTTAYRKFALDGYDYNIVDFLLKPISFERFAVSVERIMELKGGDARSDYKQKVNGEMFFRSGTKMIRANINHIRYVQGMKDYLKIYTVDEKMIVIKKTMKSMERELRDYNFIRVHKSYIVSTDLISAVKCDKIKLGDNWIPVGRNYKHHVDHYLEKSALF